MTAKLREYFCYDKVPELLETAITANGFSETVRKRQSLISNYHCENGVYDFYLLSFFDILRS